MHFNMTQESSVCDHAVSSGLGATQQVPMSTHDSLSSLQAYLMLNGGLSGIHPRAVATTAPLGPLVSSSGYVSSPQMNVVYDAHRVPGSPAPASLTPPVRTYSPLFTLDAETLPVCKSSPPTPRSAVKNLLADCKHNDSSATLSPEIQLEQFAAIKPLLRKPIDESGMTNEQKERLKRRRERNKAAATRCRVKRREKSRTIRDELTEYSQSNDELERELMQLREEKMKLKAMLSAHSHLGNCRVFELECDAEFASPASAQSDCSMSSGDSNIFSPSTTAAALASNSPPIFPARLLQRPPRLDFSSKVH